MSPSTEFIPGSTPSLAPRFAPAAVVALLAGCVAGPDFRAPDVPVPAAYRAGASLTAEEARSSAVPGEAPEAWWTLFGSGDLNALVTRALAANHDLAAARATLAGARATLEVTDAARYPAFDASVRAGRDQLGAASLGTAAFPPFTYYAVGPTVSYLFDVAGGVRRGVERQSALVESAGWQLEAARLALSGQVVAEAVNVAAARDEIATLRTLLEDDDTDVRLVRDAFDAGSANRVDMLTAASQRAADAARVPPLERALGESSHALALLLGRAPADLAPPELRLGDVREPTRLPLSVPSSLVHRRPDILAAEADLHAATAAVGIRSADLYPQLTLTGGVDFESTTPAKLFQRGSVAGSIGAGLTAPLFHHGARRAAVREAEAALEGARARFEQVVLRSFTQVADALEALDADARLIDALETALKSADENLALTRESYAAGNATVLQVLTAERLHQEASLDVVRARAERLRAAARLLLASGGVVGTGGSTPPAAVPGPRS